MTAHPARLPLCTVASRESGAQAAGTAHHWNTCIAFEATPYEWDRFRDPQRMSEAQQTALTVLGDWVASSGLGYGWVMFAPRDPVHFDPARRQVRVYSRPPGPLGTFVRQDFQASEPELWLLFSEWVAGVGHSGASPISPPEGTDWHVCTHGRVDSACGKYGVSLLNELWDLPEAERLWRTSHFGGHRFAPTLLELPAGRYWAYLTPQLTRQLMRREGEATALADCYRGCAGFVPAAQRADAAAFRHFGWWWLDVQREVYAMHEEADRFTVELKFWSPGGKSGHLRVQGQQTAVLHLPASSHSPELYPEPQYQLTLEVLEENG